MAVLLAVVLDGQTGRCAGQLWQEEECVHNLLRPPQLVAFLRVSPRQAPGSSPLMPDTDAHTTEGLGTSHLPRPATDPLLPLCLAT